jgi:hypothetical protein
MDDLETAIETSRGFRVRTQRGLQILLGLFWIIDAALQFQPFMFGHEFVNNFILANAQGQPEPFGYIITHVGNFIAPDSTVWNVFFALIQVCIGAGLLVRRTVRPALVISFVWALGVWFFGEGLGMVFTGTATALTGAPGSVLVYGLIGLMAWPRKSEELKGRSGEDEDEDELVGIASSAAGQGLGGGRTPLIVWSGYWFLAAVLFVLPDNRTQTSVSSAITGMAVGNPSFYDHFLNSVGHHLNSVGPQAAWTMAAVSLVIGIGPLVVRRPEPFLWAGLIGSLAMWIFGQGWIGGVFTGSGTDPNTGPLIILLALAMMPAVLPDPATWHSPFSGLVHRNPVVGWGGVLALGAAMAISGSYPVAAEETTSAAMAGMTDMGGSAAGAGASGSISTDSCSSGNDGISRTGLDLNNTPLMIMSGTLGMNMNGSDASAAAGINATKANWSYTGPALPNALARELLAEGANGADQLKMAATGCAKSPTDSEEINAIQYVQSTSQNVAKFDDPIAALAAGYQLVSPAAYPVTYFINPSIVAANAAAKRTLSPTHIDGLVYAKTLTGSEVLVAAMYLLPSTVKKAPMPFGALVQWHERTNVCSPLVGGGPVLDISSLLPCATGSVQRGTPYMSLVWQVPVAGGPLAIQPPDIQIVEAAIMQSLGDTPGS